MTLKKKCQAMMMKIMILKIAPRNGKVVILVMQAISIENKLGIKRRHDVILTLGTVIMVYILACER